MSSPADNNPRDYRPLRVGVLPCLRTLAQQLENYFLNKIIKKQSSQQLENKAGGKMSVQIEQNNEKHYCRVPGCHKVYSESEFLLAHLQWHKNQPPTTVNFSNF